MTKKTIILLSIVGAALLGAGLWYYFAHKKTQEYTLVTINPAYGYIAKSITATGSIQPVDTVSIGAQVSGVVKAIYADFNSVVKKGKLLAKIDPTILTAQSDQSKANLVAAKSNLKLQQSIYVRQNQLFTEGFISKSEYQLALNQLQNAKASVDNIVAQLKITQKTLYYTNIYAPIDGVVLNRNVSAGQTIASSFNAPTLFVIAKDLTKMMVRAAVDEADIGGVLVGQNVSFTVDAFPEAIFSGVVHEILLHPSVSAGVVTYTTLILVENKSLQLKPGMTASINIYLEEDSNALLIPSRALNFKPDSVLAKKYTIQKAEKSTTVALKSTGAATGTTASHKAYVWIKTGDILTEKGIDIGLDDDLHAQVLSGLTTNDTVVTNVILGVVAASTGNTQQSPFMPQMPQRKKPATPKN
jgi:HlyD family secretion protein